MSWWCRPACMCTDFGAAARTYWTLKVAGVTKVSILDGGYAAWTAEQQPDRDRAEQALADDLHRDARQGAARRRAARSRRSSAPAARRWSMRGRRRSSPARRRRRPRRPMATFRAPCNVDSATFYDAKTNRLKPKAELAALAATLSRPARRSATATPAIGRRPTGSCCRRCSAART